MRITVGGLSNAAVHLQLDPADVGHPEPMRLCDATARGSGTPGILTQ
jgi:hypothetical protein